MPPEELSAGGDEAEMSHEPLTFLSGIFKGVKRRWLVVDKETYICHRVNIPETAIHVLGRWADILRPEFGLHL